MSKLRCVAVHIDCNKKTCGKCKKWQWGMLSCRCSEFPDVCLEHAERGRSLRCADCLASEIEN